MKATFALLSMFVISASAWTYNDGGLAVYESPFTKSKHEHGFYAGGFEQYTYSATLRNNGNRIANDLGQHLHSSYTQFTLGYRFSDFFGVQLNVPYVVRKYARTEGAPSVVINGDENGVGDLSLLALMRLWQLYGDDWGAYIEVLGGVKFATGSSNRLSEELTPAPIGDDVVASGLYGHDLAIGSGSTDAILGVSAAASWSFMLVMSSMQYSLRSTGAFGYRYANNLSWKASPGVYLVRSEAHNLALTADFAGEYKERDTLNAALVNASGLTTVFFGGGLSYKWNDCIYAKIASDFPIFEGNTAMQLLPDVRARGELVIRF